MAISLENTAKLTGLRQRILKGETIPIEELREAFAIYRGDRKASAIASATSKSAKAPVDTGGILAGLKGLAGKLTQGPID